MTEENFPQLRLENQLCFPLYAAARKIVNLYTPYLKKFDLTYTQYIALMFLWEHEKAAVNDIARALYLDTGTVTPLLKKLEQKGLLERSRSDQDERKVTVYLTKEGKGLQEKIADVPRMVGTCVPLNPQEAQALYELLYKILHN